MGQVCEDELVLAGVDDPELGVSASEGPAAVVVTAAAAIASARRKSVDVGLVGVIVGVICFASVFGYLCRHQHLRFGTWSYDMAIYDQATWLIATGKEPFITVRGLNVWGHHLNPILYLLAPIYWLGGGPSELYIVQAIVMPIGAIPLYLLARDVLHSRITAGTVAGSYLLYPAVQWICWANFHPEALAVTPMLWAWWFAHRQRWRMFFVAVAFVLATREEAGLVIAAIGVVLAYRWLPIRSSVPTAGRKVAWRVALGTIVLGVGWFGVATRIFLPHFNAGAGPFYVREFFGEWGSSVPEVAWTMGTHPSRVVSAATQPDRLRYYRDLFLPLAGLPFLAPLTLLPAAPQLLGNVTGSSPYARQIFYQYNSLLVAPVFMALIDGLARIRRHSTTALRKVSFVLLVVTVVSSQAWSPAPWSEGFNSYWLKEEPRTATMRAAVALVPDNVGVSATYALLPHLAHRRRAYDWPNPWRPVLWANDNENPPSPNNVDYIVVDRQLGGGDDRATLDRLTEDGGEFKLLFDRDDIVVARRVRAASATP